MLSIIIPTLEEEEFIGRVLEDLVPQLGKSDEIIIVDSESKDKTVEIASGYGVKILMQPKNGNGIARTEGARAAKNGIVVFIDADSVVPENFVNRIKDHFSDPEVLAVGGLDLYSSESRINKTVYDTYSRAIFLLGKINKLATGQGYVPSNNSAFRKDAFLEAGGYRSVVCEDADLMRRMPEKAKIIQDSKLVLTISDRRFRKNGFLQTVALWTRSNLALVLGKEVGSEDYKKGY